MTDIRAFLQVARQMGLLDDRAVDVATRILDTAEAQGQPHSTTIESLREHLIEEPGRGAPDGEDDGMRTSAAGRRAQPTPLPDIPSLVEPGENERREQRADSLSKYELHTEIGRGGRGVVQLATDPDLGRKLAIKTLLRPQSETARQVFLTEARVTAKLEHPNIVPVHQLGRDATGSPFLAMKRVDGRNLLQIIDDWKRESGRQRIEPERLREVLDVFAKVAQAVSFAHHHGVIHRDIKPQNVMVGRFGEVLLMDWGMARILHREQRAVPLGGETLHTDSGRIAAAVDGSIGGSPAWMAPEQATGMVSQVDERTDVFALGAMLYHLLTFEPPYGGRDLDKVIANAAEARPVPPRKRAPWRGIPAELDAIVRKAMSSDASERYTSVSELLADVDAFQSHRAVQAHPDGAFRSLLKWGRRHPRASLVGVMSLVLVLVISMVGAVAAQQLAAADVRAVRTERESLLAQSRASAEREARLHAQARLATEREGRLRAEKDKLEAEHRATKEREAHLRELAGRQQWEELGRALRAVLQRMRDGVMERYNERLEAAMAAGVTGREYLYNELAPEIRQAYLHVLDDLLTPWEKANPGVDSPFTARDWTCRGLLRSLEDDHSGAIEDFNRAIALDAGYAVAWRNRGIDYGQLEQFDNALADYTEAIRLSAADTDDPNARLHHAAALINRGITLRQLKRYDEALEDLDLALELVPHSARALGVRARIRFEMGDTRGAFADLDAAVEVAPDKPVVHYNRAGFLYMYRRRTDAIRDYTRAIDLDGNFADAFLLRGVAYMDEGETSKAREDLDRAVELAPDDPNTYYYRGHWWDHADDVEAAVADYQKATEVDPTFWPAWHRIAVLRALTHRKEALDAVRNALEHCDRDEPRKELMRLLRSLGG